ncbi:MAG: LysR family transcriptional regulator [Oscillospiraceae bacterium]|nr:LysR family transcriptional regulator [Oscillospiraceae bacterium]
MESKKLEALLMAVDLGSFTKAAEVLGYTQSGLTHMMNSLEKEVGFTLLERGRSGVRLTEEGERIAPAVREFLQANARLDSVIKQVASSRTEIIRVSAYASIAMHWLPGIIQRFREECPDVDVDIRMADHVDVPYELLAQGKMDAILVSPQDEGQYEWVHLADDPMFAVLPKDFDTQGMTAFPLAAFEARDFIMPSQGFDKDIMRIFNRIGVKPHILPTWVDDPTVISMVSHGLGVSMMTELTVRGRTDGVKLLPVEPASSRELGLAVRSLDAASDGLRHFIDCTKRVVAEMQP